MSELDQYPEVSYGYPRGIYVDTRNGDLWAQVSRTGEAWRWINGDHFVKIPREYLKKVDELPDWY
jgi:hypothetical protein